MKELTTEQATRCAATILEALGAPATSAQAIAGWLVNSDCAGHPSHGIMRLRDYAKRAASGDVVAAALPELTIGAADDGPLVLVDGNAGFGHLAANELVLQLIERSRRHRFALGGIVNASHTGRLGEWAELAARNGVVLFICSASLARGNVAAFGAREARLGTNPIAIGIPGADGDSFVLDYATSEISGGKIDTLIQAALSAPANSMLDRAGNPTVDPNAFYEQGMLLAFGGHKGYGISLMIQLLGGCIVGSAAPGNARHGAFAFALDPGTFADRETVLEAIRGQLERMRTTPPQAGFESVQVPGDFERASRERTAGRVRVEDSTWHEIVAVADSLGITEAALLAQPTP